MTDDATLTACARARYVHIDTHILAGAIEKGGKLGPEERKCLWAAKSYIDAILGGYDPDPAKAYDAALEEVA